MCVSDLVALKGNREFKYCKMESNANDLCRFGGRKQEETAVLNFHLILPRKKDNKTGGYSLGL